MIARQLRSLEYSVRIVILLLLMAGWHDSAFAQVPVWAQGKIFSLDDVEIRVVRLGLMTVPDKHGDCVWGHTTTICGDGSVFLNCDREVGSVRRKVEGEVPREGIYSLLEEMLRNQFFDLPADYEFGARPSWFPWHPLLPPTDKFRIVSGNWPTDVGFFELYLKIGDHEKVVRVWSHEGPPRLFEIAKEIDEIAGIDKLTR